MEICSQNSADLARHSSSPIVLAAFLLAIGHPSLIFGDGIGRRSPLVSSSKELDVERNKEEATEVPANEPADEPADEPGDVSPKESVST